MADINGVVNSIQNGKFLLVVTPAKLKLIVGFPDVLVAQGLAAEWVFLDDVSEVENQDIIPDREGVYEMTADYHFDAEFGDYGSWYGAGDERLVIKSCICVLFQLVYKTNEALQVQRF
jgi:hypothetical protein